MVDKFGLMRVVTTLNFAGHTEAALDLYHDALGAETLFLVRFRDGPDRSLLRPDNRDKIFHATFRIGDTEFMASDVVAADSQTAPSFKGFAFAVKAESADEARRMFNALGDGGTILIPLAPSAFASWYGIVIDRFGLSWKIMVD